MGIASLFATAFLVGLTGAMIPGPMTSVAVHHSVGLGWIAGPVIVSGHAVLEAMMVAAIAFGASQFLTDPLFTGLVGILGGLALIYMGISIVRTAGGVQLAGASQESGVGLGKQTARSFAAAIAAGLTTSLSNPSWPVWWGTVGAGHVTLALRSCGAPGVVAFYAGHILSDLAWYTLLTSAVAVGGRRISQQSMSAVLKVLGIFMIAIACYFVMSGVQILTIGA